MKVHYKSSIIRDLELIPASDIIKILDKVEQEGMRFAKIKSVSEDFKNLFDLFIDNYRVVFTKIGQDLVTLRIGQKLIN